MLLFDGDLGLANVDVQLGLGPGRDLASVLTGRCRLDAGGARGSRPAGFDVVPGRSGSGQLGQLDPARFGACSPSCAHSRGATTSPCSTCRPASIPWSVACCAAADLPLVVTTDEPTALTDAYALIKVSRGAGRRRSPCSWWSISP